MTREGGGAYAQSECCPDMGGFVEGEGCIENKNCTESCSNPISTGGPTGEMFEYIWSIYVLYVVIHVFSRDSFVIF